jgi:hypothetical protein
VNSVSMKLSVLSNEYNPFKDLLIPMAIKDQGLMHALLCLSGSHLVGEDPSLAARQNYHYSRALAYLQSVGSDEPTDDCLVATTMVMCLNAICDGDTSGESRIHLNAVRNLSAQKPSSDMKFRVFIDEFVKYHDSISRITNLDPAPLEDLESAPVPPLLEQQPDNELFIGAYDGLFGFVEQITAIRRNVRVRFEQGYEPQTAYDGLREAINVDFGLRKWKSKLPKDTPRFIGAQVYKQSIWVYLYRTVQASEPNPKISAAVDGGIACLRQLPEDDTTFSVLLTPLFLLGCAAFEPAQRKEITLAFHKISKYSGLRNIQPAQEVVERIWKMMDEGDRNSWDWESVMKTMNYDFLVS